jgi:glycosyltransferase involved in cell wall biosynthesis
MGQSHSANADTRIRVLRIIARMNVGGPAVQITSLMRGLDPSLFNHKLITGYCQDNEIDYLETSAKDVFVERVKGLGRGVNLFSDLFAIIRIIKVIRRFKPHVIHTHTSKAGALGRVASILSGHKSKRIHTFHGHLLNGYFNSNKTMLYIYLEKFFSLFTDKFICVGTKVREDLIYAGIAKLEKFIVFPPGVETPSTYERLLAANHLNLPADKVYCLFLGRITKIKRLDRLIDVSLILKNNNVDVTFLVAGGGDLFKEVKERSERLNLPVIFLGWQHDLAALFSLADILVMTSDNEGTPLSVIQAQLAGVPVISTDVGSTSEILLDGVSAYLTKLEPKDIASKIEHLVHNPKERIKMGQAGKTFALEKFSPERLVSNHAELYKSLLSR